MTGAPHSKLFRMPKERPKHPMPWEGIETLDRELTKLGRGAAAMRLRLAEAMQALFEANGHRTLGFSSFGAWANERIERTGRWADDSRAVARRLAELPAIREAVYTGRLSWSAAELLARNERLATEDELLALGRSLTVRQLRAALKRRAEEADKTPDVEDDDEKEERCTLVLSVEQSHAWAFETTRRLMELLDGTKALDSVVEALLAEGMVALTPWLMEGSVPDDEAGREWREQMAQWRREAVEECEARIPDEDVEALEWEDAALPENVMDLDALCRQLSRELAERDLVLGQLVLRMFETDGWRKLGYAMESQYSQERLGLSWSSVKRRMTLARRTRRAQVVAESLEAGEIGFEAACLLARVADDRNAEAWVDRAKRRTIKHLREEVDCVETLARVNGWRGRLDPPSKATLNAWFEAERRVKSGEVFGLGRMSGGLDGPSQMSEAETAGRDAPRHELLGGSQMSGGPDGDSQMSGGLDDPSQMSGCPDEPSQMSGGPDGDSQMSGGCLDLSQMSGGPTLEEILDAIRPDALLSQMSGGPGDDDEPLGKLLRAGAGKVELRLSLREDLFRWWRALQHVHKRSGQPGPFVAFLVAEMWRVWIGELAPDVKWAHIYRRDRRQCSNPTCNRRDVTPHHLKFQSHGGGDSEDNLRDWPRIIWSTEQGGAPAVPARQPQSYRDTSRLPGRCCRGWIRRSDGQIILGQSLTSLCAECHLFGVHEGRLTVTPPANDMVWRLGRTPILEVRGRERVLLAG